MNYDYGTTDNNGNVKGQIITVPSQFTAVQNYTYDSLNRLKSATETISGSQTWKQTFTFDRYGNRKFDANQTTTLGGCPVNVCNPDINTANNRIVGHQFDNSGNTTVDAEGRQFFYDGENKQKEVRDGSNNIIGQYYYDGDGKRVKKVSAAETTLFIYDASGKMTSEYSVTTATPTAPVTSYLTNDTLGSPRVTTDGSGNVVSRRDFRPYGEEIYRPNQGTDKVRQKFTSYERDNETELDFAQARMLNTSLGRFGTPDPYNVILEKERGEDDDERAEILIGFISNPQKWNMYVYVVNNPLSFTDPDGQKPRTINVFLDAGVLTKEGLEAWQKWAADAQKKNKDLTINIYQMSAGTPETVKAFLESLKAEDTATIFMGHSFSPNGNRLGLSFHGRTLGNLQSKSKGRVSHTADGIDIRNVVLAVFSCDFGKGLDNITSSTGTAFVSIVQGLSQGAHKTTFSDATNAAAFSFAQSIANNGWHLTTFQTSLDIARFRSQSGISAYPHPQSAKVNEGDSVNYRILPPPRKKR